MSDVVFQGNADFSQVEKAYQKMAKDNAKLHDQIGKMIAAQRKAAAEEKKHMAAKSQAMTKNNSMMSKAGGMMASQIVQIGSMAAGYLSVQGALQMINFEIEKKHRLEREAARHTRTLDQAVVA